MRQITIHAGLNKAASTFLQQVFPALPGLNYYGKSLDLRSLSIDESRLPDAPALFSEESVVGVNIVSRSGDRHRDRERALEQLKFLFGDPRLVVVFRRHDEFLLSVYKQYLNLGGTASLESFLPSSGGRGFFSPDELRFRRIVEQIEERLGTPQLYLDYADLKTAPEAFVAAIARFAGGSGAPSAPAVRGPGRNVGVNRLRGEMLRGLNRASHSRLDSEGEVLRGPSILRALGLTPRNLMQLRLAKLGRKEYSLSQDQRAAIADLFQEDWEFVQSRVERIGPAEDASPPSTASLP